MRTLSSPTLAAAVGGLALSLTFGAGVASAGPDLGPIVNTTCTYPQVIAALNAQDPAAAADLEAAPDIRGMIQYFLASPPDKRLRLAQKVQAMPEAQQYVGTIVQVAGTCNNY